MAYGNLLPYKMMFRRNADK